MRAEYRGTAVAVRLHTSKLSSAAVHGVGIKKDRRHSGQRRTSVITIPAFSVWGAWGSMSKKPVDPAESSGPSPTGSAAAIGFAAATGWDDESRTFSHCQGVDNCEDQERPESVGCNAKVSQIEGALDGT